MPIDAGLWPSISVPLLMNLVMTRPGKELVVLFNAKVTVVLRPLVAEYVPANFCSASALA